MISFKNLRATKSTAVPEALTWRDVFGVSRSTSHDAPVSAREALKISAFYRAVDIRSDSIGKLPVKVKDTNTRQEQKEHYLVPVLQVAPNEAMTPFVVLGGALKPEQKANAQQHPRGFIVIMGPEKKEDFFMMDTGIAAQTIHLAAAEAGIESCMVIVFNRKEIEKLLQIPEDLCPYMILAMGSPDEERCLVEVPEDGKLAYYRDENDTHCVPKLPLDAVLISRR